MLDDIILPNTLPSVREAYYQLAKRSQVEDFDLLEEEVCVLDTETTGLSFYECQLTEIACARLKGRTITARFHTYVNPGQPIPKKIIELTGIKDSDVVDAPRPKEAVAALADFVKGAPVLAHNANFDRTFIERVAGGYRVSNIWIDTLALSRIALPRLSTHRLQDMAEAFGCASVTHRAMDDVEALCGMWRVMLCALSDLPQGLLRLLSEMHDDIEWPYRSIFSKLAFIRGDGAFSLVGHRTELVDSQEAPLRKDCDELIGQLKGSTKGDIQSAFDVGGPIDHMYKHFEPRAQQLEMAHLVNQALATSSMCSIEAGTGVGKSMAYLYPLVLYAKKNNITCGVATKTNALTDQLVSRELPALNQALPGGVSYVCLKGFDHYPCLRKLSSVARSHKLPLDAVHITNKRNKRSDTTLAQDMLTAIAVTYAYVCQSIEGDIDSLGIRWGSVPRGMLTTTSNECQRSLCPFYSRLCLLHGARRRSGACDIVVTNHSLLLRDIEADHNILPPIRNWVIDEAHSFEAEARKQWALEASAQSTQLMFEMLGSSKSGVIGSASLRAAKTEGATPLIGVLSKTASTAAQAQVSASAFFDAVRGLAALARTTGGYDNTTLWISSDVRQTSQWREVVEVGNEFIDRLEALAKDLSDAERLADSSGIEAARGDLADVLYRVTNLQKAAKTICVGTDESYVYSAEVSKSSRYIGEERLLAEKLDIGAELARRWYSDMHSVTFSSATMTVGATFDHFREALGLNLLENASVREAALESCYDFDTNMAAIVTNDMPDPYDPNYLSALEDLLFDVHVAMGGSVLTLFTNKREMQTVYDGLSARLAQEGLEVAIQDSANSSRRLSKRFVEEKTLSLMALKSFWEGFDAAGDTLRCVVIPKLPFSSPNDPLSQERASRDKQAWRKWSLPEAVISVKQAAGRLIRTSTDTGVLILADARLNTKGYGKVFMRSLPTKNVQSLGCDMVPRYLTTWRKNH